MDGGDQTKTKKKFSFERKNFIIAVMAIILVIILAFAFMSRESFLIRRSVPDKYTDYEIYKLNL